MAVQRTAYFGTFVHSKSLTELEISHNSLICVDEYGKIAAVEKDLPSVFAVGAVLGKLGWTTEEKAKEKPQASHLEHLNGREEHGGHVHDVEECRHCGEFQSDDYSMEGLEHVGNGVRVLENGVDGHGTTKNDDDTENGPVANENEHVPNGHASNGAVPKSKPEVKLVISGKEEFFFPGFIGPFLLSFPFLSFPPFLQD